MIDTALTSLLSLARYFLLPSDLCIGSPGFLAGEEILTGPLRILNRRLVSEHRNR